MILVFSEDSGGKYNQKNLSNKKNLLFFDKFPVTASGRGAAGEPVADVAAELSAGRWRILRRFVSQHSRRSAKVPGRTLCRACRRVGADVVSSLSEGRGRLRRGCRRAGGGRCGGVVGWTVADIAAVCFAAQPQISQSPRADVVSGLSESRGGRCVEPVGGSGAVAAGLPESRGQTLRRGCLFRRAAGAAGALGWMLRRSFSGGGGVRRRPGFAVFAVSPDADARKAPRHAAEPAFLPIFAHIWQ